MIVDGIQILTFIQKLAFYFPTLPTAEAIKQ